MILCELKYWKIVFFSEHFPFSCHDVLVPQVNGNHQNCMKKVEITCSNLLNKKLCGKKLNLILTLLVALCTITFLIVFNLWSKEHGNISIFDGESNGIGEKKFQVY